jgi:2,4-dienoyl-CoA reductase (NADPH2)
VEFYADARYEAILPGGVRFRDAAAKERFVPADTVVIAAGQERNDALLSVIAPLNVPYRVVGGAKNAAELDAVRAFEEGLRAAHELARVKERGRKGKDLNPAHRLR